MMDLPLSTKVEGFLNIESVGIDGEAMFACGDTCDRKGDVVFTFEQFLLANQ